MNTTPWQPMLKTAIATAAVEAGLSVAASLEGANAKRFILAGNARVTLVSKVTGARYTYAVRQKDAKSPHFVSVLTGSDNESDFAFLGTVFDGAKFFHGKKSRISQAAPSAKAWAWAWKFIARGETPPNCEIWHEGRCGRCNRALTVPESILTGLGPDCADKMGVVMAKPVAPKATQAAQEASEDCRAHTKTDGSWWEHDAQGIPLCRVCDKCRDEKLSHYRPEILTGYDQRDMDERIEAED